MLVTHVYDFDAEKSKLMTHLGKQVRVDLKLPNNSRTRRVRSRMTGCNQSNHVFSVLGP